MLRLWPPLTSPFSLLSMLCGFSFLNTAFYKAPQLALVDQYEAMLRVHSLHHLTVQEGALQLRQTQAVRLPRSSQNSTHSSGINLSSSRWGQAGGIQWELVLLWQKSLSGGPQDLLLAASRVAEAQAAGSSFMRLSVVELVVQVRSWRQMLGVVVMGHVGIITEGLAWFHHRAQVMSVVEWRWGLRAALLLGLRLVGGWHGGALRGTLGCRWVQRSAACWVGSFINLHLVEVGLQPHALWLLLQVHPLLMQSAGRTGVTHFKQDNTLNQDKLKQKFSRAQNMKPQFPKKWWCTG